MTRRERLLHTLRGEAVDRPAVSFYEIGLFAYDADDPDPFNVHNDPSWRELIQLAESRTDLMRGVGAMAALPAMAISSFKSAFVKIPACSLLSRYTTPVIRSLYRSGAQRIERSRSP